MWKACSCSWVSRLGPPSQASASHPSPSSMGGVPMGRTCLASPHPTRACRQPGEMDQAEDRSAARALTSWQPAPQCALLALGSMQNRHGVAAGPAGHRCSADDRRVHHHRHRRPEPEPAGTDRAVAGGRVPHCSASVAVQPCRGGACAHAVAPSADRIILSLPCPCSPALQLSGISTVYAAPASPQATITGFTDGGCAISGSWSSV